jgi:hypothetical protein
MKDHVCDSATQVRIPETISVAAAVLLPIVQGSYSSPAIAGNMLYVGSTGGTLSAVDLNTHQMAWTFTTDAAKQNGAAFTKKDGASGYFEAFRGQQYMDTVADYAKLDAIGLILSS